MAELLSCPFCGEGDYLLVAQVRTSGMQWWAVECGCHAYGGAGNTEADAVAAWNTRARTFGEGDVERVASAIWPLAEWDGERLNAVNAASAALAALQSKDG